MRYTMIATVVALAIGHLASAGGVLFVDDDAAGGGDGLTWDTAYRFLQDALTFASEPANGVTEIRVGQGTYKPDRDEADPEGTGDREATFNLINGLSLLGGYAGIGAEDPDERDVDLYETVLSGDLAGNDGPGFVNYEENTLNILTGEDLDDATLLEGWFVIGGNNEGGPLDGGAGLTVTLSSLTVRDCRFLFNFASTVGGAVAARGGEPVFERCLFDGNRVENDFGVGAFVCLGSGHFQLHECVFVRNSTDSWAGAVNNQNAGLLTAIGCLFLDNEASGNGGAIGLWNQGEAVLVNCLFQGNKAGSDGGALAVRDSFATLINCTVVSNIALDGLGGGLYADVINGPISQAVLRNSVFWGNLDALPEATLDDQISADEPAILKITYSCIQDIDPENGLGNIADDPLFVDLLGPDGEPATGDEDLRLHAGSPCIDAGDNTWIPVDVVTDLDGNPRFVDDPGTKDTGVGRPPIVDMGAYEFQGVSCFWDLDGDDSVGTGDLILLLGSWGDPYGTADLIELLGNWGPCAK